MNCINPKAFGQNRAKYDEITAGASFHAQWATNPAHQLAGEFFFDMAQWAITNFNKKETDDK